MAKFLTLKAVFATKNIAFTLLNIFIFVTVQIIFFITVGSNSQKDEAFKKSELFKTFLKNSPNAKTIFCKQQQSEETIAKNAENEKSFETKRLNRDAHNLETVKSIFMIPMIVLGVIIVLCLIRNAENLNRMDAVVLFAIFLAFSTELFYYFVVFKNITFVGNLEILSEFKKPLSTHDLPAIKPVYDKYVLQDNYYYRCRDTAHFYPPLCNNGLTSGDIVCQGKTVKYWFCPNVETYCYLQTNEKFFNRCGL